MTVAELIEKLREMPQEAPAVVGRGSASQDEVVSKVERANYRLGPERKVPIRIAGSS
jgi:hypothetical protein